MRVGSTLVSLGLLLGIAGSRVYADATQTLVDEATALYERADLAGALAKLEAAYAKSARADILFGIARIHVERGDCTKGIEVYRKFLESKPGPRSTQIATEKIAECQTILAHSQPDVAEPEPPPRTPSGPIAPRTRTITHAWYTDVVGDVLVVVGLGAVGTSIYFARSAADDVARANEGGTGGVTLADYTALRERADDEKRYAWFAAGVGGALVISGLFKYALSDRTEVVPIAGGGVAVRGRF